MGGGKGMNEIIRMELPAHLATKSLRREWIIGLEESLTEVSEFPQGDRPDCPLVHSFCDGFYVREIFIPAGMMLTGKIHKHEHPNFLMQGKVSMITEDGGALLMEGPQSLISPSGCKRALYTHTPTWWITVHLNPNGHTEFNDEFEDEIIANDFIELTFDKAVE
jgi:hypothetical protein